MATLHGKHKVLRLGRMALLKEEDKKLRRCEVAENYGVSDATVSLIVKKEKKIEDGVAKSVSVPQALKALKLNI